ncbi:MAG TPA: histidine kinase [Propionibacteriaceae bacterium]|nr:histidine kinase [Propionibacteriaceae bacterium]
MGFDRLIRPLGRLRHVPPLVVDAGIAATFIVMVAAEAVRQPMPSARTALFALLTLVLAASLVLRRKWPLAALVFGVAALVVESFLHVATVFTPLATLVGAYSVGLYATRTRARWGLLIIVAGVIGYFVGTPGLRRTDPVQLAYVLLVWLGGWAFGYARARRGEDQERVRRALEREVIAEERVRMSRELHDVVGHTVNLLVVQAGAARMTLEQDPAQARELLKSMEDTGRATLADLDRVLATLRGDPQPADQRSGTMIPAPGLAQLPELVGRFHDSGVDTRLSVDPGLRLPRDLDLSAYRIVQEALTNTLKHAAPCAATVAVQRANGSMIIEVSDTGPGVGQTDPNGRGLVGIAERVSMCGGVLEHGNGEHGGFRLRAVLPLP